MTWLSRILTRRFSSYKKQTAPIHQDPPCRLVIPVDLSECIQCPLGKRTTLGHALGGVSVCELLVIDCHNDLEAYVRREVNGG